MPPAFQQPLLAQPRLPQPAGMVPQVQGPPPQYPQQPPGWNPGAPQPVPFPTSPSRPAATPPRPELVVQMPSQPIFRGVAAEEEEPAPIAVVRTPPAPEPVTLPTPEELGVTAAPVAPSLAAVDWNVTRQRLQRLGVLSFQVQRLEQNYRVAFELPTTQSNQTHIIEVVAASEAQAVMLALQRAEQWLRGR